MYGKSLFGAGNNNDAQGNGLSSYQFGQAEQAPQPPPNHTQGKQI